MDKAIEGRGVWIHPAQSWSRKPNVGKVQLERDLRLLRDHNVNFIIPLVKDSGGVSYSSKIVPSHRFRQWDPLEETVIVSRKFGMETYPWFCVFPEGEANLKGPLIAHPEWAVVNSKGKKYGYSDPAKADARRYETSLILEVLNNYDVDGIMLDYTRYPASDYCYCDYCCSQFMKEHGANPKELPKRGELRERWDSWRRERVTSFVKDLSESVHSAKPRAKLASYCWTTASLYNVYQDWPAWARRGYLDFITPTGYVYDMDLFRSVCLHIKIAIADVVPTLVTIGVQTSHGKLKRGELIRQIRIAREEKLDGVTLFHWEALRRFLPELRRAFAKSADMPHRAT